MEIQPEQSSHEIIAKIKSFVGPSLVILIVAWVVYYSLVKQYFTDSKGAMTNCGLFGDMFGGFNAFFAGLGFIAVAITTVIQMQQAHRTQTETTFFNMLNLLTQIVSNSYSPDSQDSGQAYLKKAMTSLQGAYNERVMNALCRLCEKELPANSKWKDQADFLVNTKLPPEVHKQLIIEAYEDFYTDHEHNLGHYFRYLYNIIKFIRKSYSHDEKTAVQYVSLIQAQMSNDELCLLFYNAISKHGRNIEGIDVFRGWLDDYDFFENIDPRCIFHESFPEFYPRTRFKFKIREQMHQPERCT